MDFGIHYQLSCAPHQSPGQRYRDTIEQAVQAEQLGFESVWPVEQHFNASVSVLPSPMIMLAAIATRTTRLRLGTAIILMPLTHPLRVAEEAGMIDVLSDGRLELGLGRGSLAIHFHGYGMSQADNRERMLEGVEMIRAAWTSDRLTFNGTYYQVEDLQVVPKPTQRLPLFRFATNSPDSFPTMGKLGNAILIGSHVNAFPRLRELVPQYWEARRAAGHPSTGNEVSMVTPLFVGESREQVRRDVEASVKNFFKSGASFPTKDPRLMQVLERFRNTNYEQVDEVNGIFGTPEYCIERIRAAEAEFGLSRLICWFNLGGLVPHETVMRSMELFAREVMPHFRKRAGQPVASRLEPATGR